MKRIFAAFIALLAFGAQAQEYPSKPISMIVAFPPGGVAELVGRPLAARSVRLSRPKRRRTAIRSS